jgi:hypothetical protein
MSPAVAHSRPMATRKTGGPSGQHKSPRRILSASREQWEAWDEAARRAGMTWADWVRELQRAEIARQKRPRKQST